MKAVLYILFIGMLSNRMDVNIQILLIILHAIQAISFV